MRYKIVASGFSRECLTWADDIDLELVKERLRRDGFVEFVITEDVVE